MPVISKDGYDYMMGMVFKRMMPELVFFLVRYHCRCHVSSGVPPLPLHIRSRLLSSEGMGLCQAFRQVKSGPCSARFIECVLLKSHGDGAIYVTGTGGHPMAMKTMKSCQTAATLLQDEVEAVLGPFLSDLRDNKTAGAGSGDSSGHANEEHEDRMTNEEHEDSRILRFAPLENQTLHINISPHLIGITTSGVSGAMLVSLIGMFGKYRRREGVAMIFTEVSLEGDLQQVDGFQGTDFAALCESQGIASCVVGGPHSCMVVRRLESDPVVMATRGHITVTTCTNIMDALPLFLVPRGE